MFKADEKRVLFNFYQACIRILTANGHWPAGQALHFLNTVFSQQHGWRLEHSGMWCCVGWVRSSQQ